MEKYTYQRGLPANAHHKQMQAGQILLIIVLVMTVALTIGLAVATRTITNIRTASEEESSQRAFSAAEAGIEQALQTSAGVSGSFSNNTSYNTTISTLTGQEFMLNNGFPVLKDEAADLWLSTYPNYTNPWDGTVTIYWGVSTKQCTSSEQSNTLAALELVLISGTSGNPKVTQYALDPCSSRVSDNNFEAATVGGKTIDGKDLLYRKTISITSGLLMRIIPLYGESLIGVVGCDASGGNCKSFPAQGTIISSVGYAGDTQRKIIGFQAYPNLPVQFFPFVLFSPK